MNQNKYYNYNYSEGDNGDGEGCDWDGAVRVDGAGPVEVDGADLVGGDGVNSRFLLHRRRNLSLHNLQLCWRISSISVPDKFQALLQQLIQFVSCLNGFFPVNDERIFILYNSIFTYKYVLITFCASNIETNQAIIL